MKPPSVLAWVVAVVAVTSPAPVHAAPDAAKVANAKIFMDSNIIPSYESSTTPLERKFDLPIGLWRIDRHWRGLALQDTLNVPSNFWKPLVKIRGIARVSQFYNGRALPCLHKQNMFGFYKKKEFIKVMNKVAACLYPDMKINDDVDVGVNDPVAITKEDMAEDVATPAPTVAPTAAPVATVAPTTEPPKAVFTSSPVVTQAAETFMPTQPVIPDFIIPTEPVMPEPTRAAEPVKVEEPIPVLLPIQEPEPVRPAVQEPEPIEPARPVESIEPQQPAEPSSLLEPSLPSEPSQPQSVVEPFTPLEVTEPDNEPVVEPISVPVTEPVVEPISVPVSEPVIEPVVVPVPTNPGLPVPTYFYDPASTQVAPFFALDFNEDKRIKPEEWPQYVARVRQVALKEITKGQHPTAVRLLQVITDFHYNALTHCIDARLYALEEPSLDDNTSSFDDFTKWVENNCNVKFRFSLLAGPPPFEWIAKDRPIITAADVTRWLNTRLATAKKDLASLKITTATSDQIRAANSVVKCALDIIGRSSGSGINRDAYYELLTHIHRCVASANA